MPTSKQGGITKWKKGVSGNPGGRPKEIAELKQLARSHTEEAITRLVYWMRHKDPRYSIPAANMILDRGYGKPAQYHDIRSESESTLTIEGPSNLELARQIAHVLTVAKSEQETNTRH